MIPNQTTLRRWKLLDRLLEIGEILRGSLLGRTIRNHARGCAKCASGECYPLSVLTVTYPCGRTRQLGLSREQAPDVRRRLDNYHRRSNKALRLICELNRELLRAERDASKVLRKSSD